MFRSGYIMNFRSYWKIEIAIIHFCSRNTKIRFRSPFTICPRMKTKKSFGNIIFPWLFPHGCLYPLIPSKKIESEI